LFIKKDGGVLIRIMFEKNKINASRKLKENLHIETEGVLSYLKIKK